MRSRLFSAVSALVFLPTMFLLRYYNILLLASLLTISLPLSALSKQRKNAEILQKMFSYRTSVTDSIRDSSSYVYVKYHINTRKRNFTLLLVPSLYAIAKGRREYFGETYSHVILHDLSHYETDRKVNINTIPHHRNTMPNLLPYLTPTIYSETVVNNSLLSPFSKANKRDYKYRIAPMMNGRIRVGFQPKLHNTQLVHGSAVVDEETGRIISAQLTGEYDMIRFTLEIQMGKEGIRSLLPTTCTISARFSFIGNKLSTKMTAIYGLKAAVPDSIDNSHDESLMASLRPIELTEEENLLYKKHAQTASAKDSTTNNDKKNYRESRIWEKIGRNLIERIRTNYGQNNRGYLRIAPILNPLYMGYSPNKGITYKFDVRSSYSFTDNSAVSFRVKSGYSFKQKVLYYSVPFRFDYNKRHNGYLEVEFGNGNRITNSSVLEQIRHEKGDSINWANMHLDFFKDMNLSITNNYDITEKLGLRAGFVYHRRSAVDKVPFIATGKPTTYHSFAPIFRVQYRPWGWNGMILTFDYERGIGKLFHSNGQYERWESDASYKYKLRSLRTISMRLGSGLYTSRGDNVYFLDYTNFRETYIPNGWNDDWTGSFELLNSNWYNASKYYVRTNFTYESPLMFLSRLPAVGQFMEIERIYVSTLFVQRLHPYIECGYGFTNRLFSMGIFIANKNGKFDGVGCKFGFELFSHW